MEWLSEIGVCQGRLQGVVFQCNGERTAMEVSEFHKQGIPTAEDTVIRARVSSAHFKTADSSQLLAQVGLSLPKEHQNLHTLWQIFVDGCRLIVPALAMMRGFFEPTRYMLQELFKPQAVDRVSWSSCDASPTVRIHAPWYRLAKSQRLRDPAPLLEWIHQCPSARAMADSVHQSALSGRVHLELPLCDMDLRFRGKSFPTGVLVTSVEVMGIRSYEVDQRGESAPRLCSLGKSRIRPTAHAPHKELHEYFVVKHRDGTVFISDEEWPEVLNILQNFRDVRGGKFDKRLLLDGILSKLHTKNPWRKSSYLVGSWNNAAQTFRDMERKGSLLPVLKYLRECRSD